MESENSFVIALQLIGRLDPAVVEVSLRSLMISGCAVLISSVIALPLGAFVAVGRFPGRSVVDFLMTTLIAVPAVLIGLLGSQILGAQGPLDFLHLMFTVPGMILAQAVLILPLLAAFTRISVGAEWERVGEQVLAVGGNRFQAALILLIDARLALVSVLLAGFGRALGEVGTANIIGGNILGETAVLPTQIMQNAQMGQFALANALGIVLILLAVAANLVGRLAVKLSAGRQAKIQLL